MTETDLLQAFIRDRSEDAFRELVRRYAALVYSVAKRRLGNPSLAEDITQLVFIRLANTPPKVTSPAHLAAWLHRTTLNVTIDTWRSESRRRNREEQAATVEPATPNTLWNDVAPKLDEALNQLSDDDRESLLLRFFRNKSMRDIGTELGISEDAAKMRISRAVQRLRGELGSLGSLLTAAVLTTVLTERSVEAAPNHLLAQLAAIKLPATAVATGGFIAALRTVSTLKLAIGVALMALLATSVVTIVGRNRVEPSSTSDRQMIATKTPSVLAHPRRFQPYEPSTEASKSAKTRFHVLDAQTGVGLANVKIYCAYFGVFGEGEGHHQTSTDSYGTAAIPQPDDPTKIIANVFITAEQHVPIAVALRGQYPNDYTVKLAPARTVAGTVVDDEGKPVGDVKLLVQTPNAKDGPGENIDFQTCPVTTQQDGRWTCSYIPFDYTNEIKFILVKKGYASTHPTVPVNKVNLTNMVFVLDRGFTITGHVTDSEQHPITNADLAIIAGVHENRQKTHTDAAGEFTVSGVVGESENGFYTDPPVETNAAGAIVIHGVAAQAAVQAKLAIQAQGFAPQSRTVSLGDVTNIVDFQLAPGNIFRGHVVDESNNPIPNAIVRTGWNSEGLRFFEWETRTDAEGHFEWDSAPAQPQLFWFEAVGYQWKRGIMLAADGTDHEITLKRKVPTHN